MDVSTNALIGRSDGRSNMKILPPEEESEVAARAERVPRTDRDIIVDVVVYVGGAIDVIVGWHLEAGIVKFDVEVMIVFDSE